MKKEVKIGIYAVIILLASWAGIRFLSGASIFNTTNSYYAYYDDASGLQSASAVMIRGVKVGQVADITVSPEEPTKVRVEITVEDNYTLPSDSKATIVSMGLMGGKAIDVRLGASEQMLEDGGVIATAVERDLMAMASEEFSDIKGKIVELVDNLNATVCNLNTLVDNNDANITSAIANLNAVLAELKQSGIIENVDNFTQKLDGAGERLDSILVNVNAITTDLKEREAGRELAESIATLNEVLAKINSNEGSVGGLLNDRQ